MTKQCTVCKEVKEYREFNARSQSKDGLQSLCRGCQASYDKDYYERNRESRLKKVEAYRNENRSGINKRARERLRIRKTKVYSHYSGEVPVCACCSETHTEFLTVDHVNNDGAKHREEVNSSELYQWLIDNNYPEGFQILCFNCNWAKSHGGCPHVKEKDKSKG